MVDEKFYTTDRNRTRMKKKFDGENAKKFFGTKQIIFLFNYAVNTIFVRRFKNSMSSIRRPSTIDTTNVRRRTIKQTNAEESTVRR